jgi:hypothetical protein
MSAGTRDRPTYREAFAEVDGEDRLRGQYYAYRSELGLVAGMLLSVAFTIDAPRAAVWPYLKDFNLWMNAAGYYYSGVVGDLEGRSFRAGAAPDDFDGPHRYDVVRVIPEYLIVFSQPTPEGAYVNPVTGKPFGSGGVSAGFHSVAIEEFGGRTYVDFHMEHGSVAAGPDEADGIDFDEAVAAWRELTDSSLPRWRDIFIPTLRKLVAEGGS